MVGGGLAGFALSLVGGRVGGGLLGDDCWCRLAVGGGGHGSGGVAWLLASSRVWSGIEWKIGVVGRAFVSSPRCWLAGWLAAGWRGSKQASKQAGESSSSGESKATRAEVLRDHATIN